MIYVLPRKENQWVAYDGKGYRLAVLKDGKIEMNSDLAHTRKGEMAENVMKGILFGLR